MYAEWIVFVFDFNITDILNGSTYTKNFDIEIDMKVILTFYGLAHASLALFLDFAICQCAESGIKLVWSFTLSIAPTLLYMCNVTTKIKMVFFIEVVDASCFYDCMVMVKVTGDGRWKQR